MARALTPQDCYNVMTALIHEAVGEKSTIQTVNSANFVSAGETVLATGTENTLNALSILVGRTLIGTRPYKAIFDIVEERDGDLYNQRVRKIKNYSKDQIEVGYWNTQLHSENLKDGEENTSHGTGTASAVGSQWEQNQPVVAEMFFGGSTVWEDSLTIYEDQLKVAFSSEAEFSKFYSSIMTAKANDIEMQKEAMNRMTFINYMAGLYDLGTAGRMAGSAVDLTELFNTTFGTDYSRQELLTVYFKEFLEFFIATIKKYSRQLRNNSIRYHLTMPKTVNGVSYSLKAHSSRDRQKLVLYNPLVIDAEARVLPEIFNDEYLKFENFEGVDFWQNENVPSAIKCSPAIMGADGVQTTGTTVDLDYVVGAIFDKDACVINHNLEKVLSTGVEARKGYRNVFWHYAKNAQNDFTEPGILFYMSPNESDSDS